jgi:type IV pilus assembly protein PilB
VAIESPRIITPKSGIGALLLESGEITKEQLEEALQHHREKAKKGRRGLLGQTLVELGFCTEEAITRAIARQAGVELVTLDKVEIDPAAAALVEPDTARRYRAMPIGFDKGRLVVAMMHPNDIVTLDDLRLLTGYEIKPVCVSDSELNGAIEQYSGTATEVEEEIEEETEEEIEEEAKDHAVVAEKPAVQLANLILNQAVRKGASDVHIEPQDKRLRVRFRIDGVLHEVMQPPQRLQASLISRIKVMAGMDIANRRVPQDGRTTLKVDGRVIDFRVASLPAAYGEKLTLRLLDRNARVITLQELGFPADQLATFEKVIASPLFPDRQPRPDVVLPPVCRNDPGRNDRLARPGNAGCPN